MNTNNTVRAVMLLPRYILMLIVITFVGELSYMVFYATTCLTAGSRIMLLDGGALVRGLAVVVPIVMLSSGAMLAVHRVRHSGGGILSILSYIVMGGLTWFLLFPALLGVLEKVDNGSADDAQSGALIGRTHNLTGGYFREYGRDTVYFPRDAETDIMAAVYINSYEEASDAVSIKLISREQMIEDAAPFSDILIKETVPKVAGWIMLGFEQFKKGAYEAKDGGVLSWMEFASLGVVLFCVYALSFCSQWRLMSVVIMLSMYTGVLSFNALYNSPLLGGLRRWSRTMPFGNEQSLLVCVNLSLAVLFVLLGALFCLARARRDV